MDDDKPKSYQEHKEEVREKQSGLSYQDVKAIMAAKSDFITELDNLPTQQHSWTDRGLKYTCENAGHSYHEAWKRRKATI